MSTQYSVRVYICQAGILLKICGLVLLTFGPRVTQAQNLWEGSQFIEYPDSSYQVKILAPTADLKAITKELQPKRKKTKILENEAILSMTYVVYEHAAIGQRSFGRIRYKINIKKDGSLLIGHFKDFTFKKIERSARYGKLEEVGRPKQLFNAKDHLTKAQWEIIRWKTEVVVQRKVAAMSFRDLQAKGE